ncbi:MAG: hypothetical protein ABI895_17490 [Deltaproteobacteria bacterium]
MTDIKIIVVFEVIVVAGIGPAGLPYAKAIHALSVAIALFAGLELPAGSRLAFHDLRAAKGNKQRTEHQ